MIVGLMGVAALNALLQQGEDMFVGKYDVFPEDTGLAWLRLWGWSIAVVTGAWSGILTCLQWSATWRRRIAQPSKARQ